MFAVFAFESSLCYAGVQSPVPVPVHRNDLNLILELYIQLCTIFCNIYHLSIEFNLRLGEF